MNQNTIPITLLLVLALTASALAVGAISDSSEAQSEAWAVDQADGMTVVYDDGTKLRIKLDTDPGAAMYTVSISAPSIQKTLQASGQDVLVDLGEVLSKEETYLIVAFGAGWSAQCIMKNVDVFDIKTVVTPAGTGSVTGAGSYNSGTLVTLSAVAGDGYVFEGWYLGETKVSVDGEYAVTADSDKEYSARFIPQKPVSEEKEITFSDEYLKVYSGTNQITSGTKVLPGTILTVSAERDGHTSEIFLGDDRMDDSNFEVTTDVFIKVVWTSAGSPVTNPDGSVTTESTSETETSDGTVVVENTKVNTQEDKGITTTNTVKTETKDDKVTRTETTTVVTVQEDKGITTTNTVKTETKDDKVTTTEENKVELSPAAVTSESTTEGNLVLDLGSVTVDFSKDVATNFEGKYLSISSVVGKEVSSMESLPGDVKEVALVISFVLVSGQSQIHDLGGTATVTVFYGKGQDVSHVAIWHMGDDGKLIEKITKFTYDPVSGNVTFDATAFSTFIFGEGEESEDNTLMVIAVIVVIVAVFTVGMLFCIRRVEKA